MTGLPLSIPRLVSAPILLLALCLPAAQAGARSPKPPKYPLHLHVLASDETHKTPRMSPAQSLVCDEIEGMMDSIGPGLGGPIALSGVSGDPCSMHPELATMRLLNLGDDAPVFSGAGRGDLVSPPVTTEGITFRYDDCVRMRVRPGFQSLPARWKKPGQKLEVLIPSDGIPAHGRPLPPVKCSLTVTRHDFVYLLLRNGNIVEVSQDLFREKPAMRVLMSGRTETMQRRVQDFTVPAHPVQ